GYSLCSKSYWQRLNSCRDCSFWYCWLCCDLWAKGSHGATCSDTDRFCSTARCSRYVGFCFGSVAARLYGGCSHSRCSSAFWSSLTIAPVPLERRGKELEKTSSCRPSGSSYLSLCWAIDLPGIHCSVVPRYECLDGRTYPSKVFGGSYFS